VKQGKKGTMGQWFKYIRSGPGEKEMIPRNGEKRRKQRASKAFVKQSMWGGAIVFAGRHGNAAFK